MQLKKPLLTLLVLLFLCSITNAETVMRVYCNRGEPCRTYPVADIVKLTFELDTCLTVEDLEKLENITKCFKLRCNYPNPFNPSTTIDYEVSQPGMLEIRIYDVLGSERKEPGNYQAVWDGRTSASQKVAAGVYFYRLSLDGVSDTKKMLLVK